MPRQRSRSTSPEVRDRNTRDILGRPGLAGMVRIGGRSAGRGRVASAVQQPFPEPGGPNDAGAGQLLVLTATADSIASGGDYVTFDVELHRRGFDEADIADGQTVIWPIDTVGSIQVELAWATYEGGGTVEIEVDGTVPAWGTIGEGTSGTGGSKRRGVDIAAGAAVRIKVTQTSGAAQTADVLVEFKVDGPTGSVPAQNWVKLADAVPSTVSPAPWTVFHTSTGTTFEWDGTGTVVLSSTTSGAGVIYIDNYIDLDVTHEDASTANYTYDSNPTCGSSEPEIVHDVTAYFEAGSNVVDLALSDNACLGGNYGTSDIYLVQVV